MGESTQPSSANGPGQPASGCRPVAFPNSIPFLIGVWLVFSCLLVLPLGGVVFAVLDGLGWIANLGVVLTTCLVLVVLVVALIWGLFAALLVKVTREWAARRRYFRAE